MTGIIFLITKLPKKEKMLHKKYETPDMPKKYSFYPPPYPMFQKIISKMHKITKQPPDVTQQILFGECFVTRICSYSQHHVPSSLHQHDAAVQHDQQYCYAPTHDKCIKFYILYHATPYYLVLIEIIILKLGNLC